MASFFCSNEERPGLLGQSIFATDAIQAARNSRMVDVMGFKEIGVDGIWVTVEGVGFNGIVLGLFVSTWVGVETETGEEDGLEASTGSFFLICSFSTTCLMEEHELIRVKRASMVERYRILRMF